MLARCPASRGTRAGAHDALRAFPALSAGQRRADHDRGEKCGLRFGERENEVADRICRFVDAVGDRERVIAGCDRVFSTFAGWAMVPADVAWKKMQMLTDGARRASDRL